MEGMNSEMLLELANGVIPFGKYKGRRYIHIPVSYLEWMAKEGFPKTKMGQQLATLYEIKINGLDYLLQELRK